MAVLAELLTVSLVFEWVQTSVKDLSLGKYENCMFVNLMGRIWLQLLQI